MGLRDVGINLLNKIINGVLIPQANEYLNWIAERARQTAPTKNIKSAITVVPAQVFSDGTIRGHIEIDLEIAPEARAYEFGSGMHATKETPGTYPILPKNVGGLAFRWDKADPSKHIILPDGRVLLGRVDHPGVEARPYMIPAFTNPSGFQFLQSRIFDRLNTEFSFSFRENLNRDI